MKYQIVYNATDKTATVQDHGTVLSPGSSIIGYFTHDDIGNPLGVSNTDTLYYYVQQALNSVGVTDMAGIVISSTATMVPISKDYTSGSARAVFDGTGAIIGLMNKNGLVVTLAELGLGGVNIEQLQEDLGLPSKTVMQGLVPTVEAGLAKIVIGSQEYAMLPLDENGAIVANLSHRYDSLANLMLAVGNPGELGVPTDAEGYVVYGAGGVAKHVPRFDNATALGANSKAVGVGAATAVAAEKSMAFGNMETRFPGEYGYGAIKKGIRKSLIMSHTVTTNATAKGFGPSSGIFILPVLAGLYQVRMTAFVRDGYTNQWQRFVREILVAVADDQSTTSIVSTDTPIPDRSLGLTGCAVNVIAGGGGTFLPQVQGLAGRTLNWGIFLEIEAFTEEVLE